MIDQPACSAPRDGRRIDARTARLPSGDRKAGRCAIESPSGQGAETGDFVLLRAGIPTFWAEGGFTPEELQATANATCGWWHHSLEFTFDKIDWDWMAEHIHIYGAYLWELCTAPILPFEFVSVADQFKNRIGELATAGKSVGVDSLAHTRTRSRLQRSGLKPPRRTGTRSIAATRAMDEAPALALNTCIKRLSRLLLPVVSTAKGTYGHDTFSYTPQSTVIPSLYDVPKLSRTQDGPERWLLETQLVRERNRVSDALIDARRVIERTLTSLP